MVAANHIALSALLREVKQTLVDRFLSPVWVTAEIAEMKVHASGHCYLDLVEKGSREGVPKAQARAVIWRNHYSQIAARFATETGRPLAVGMQVLASVLVTYHELYGFSLQIINIDPTFTLGEMERQRHETIARLQEEGLWELNAKRELPLVVQRIALISSAQAAGYRDFCKELERAPYAFRLTLFEAAMQGMQAEESLTAALASVAARSTEFDAVVIVRGGGSTSDLNCFNTYGLCAALARMPLPVITGIGHDKDQSVADLVAHTALKTPTAVAGWLIERLSAIDAYLQGAALQLHDAVLRTERNAALQLERMQNLLQQYAREALLRRSLQLELHATQLPQLVRTALAQEKVRLERAEEGIESRSPQAVLRMGFAIVRGGDRALRSVEELKLHPTLSIELADGNTEIQNLEFKINH
ncbi:MAG: exodeoxyribonuclease VII large subunit [Alistipes sp.]|nr:exodeoxyribonuclease VII large subunit [Alistipes sp.]